MTDISSLYTIGATPAELRVLYQAIPTTEVGFRDRRVYAGFALIKITTDDQYDPVYEEISAIGDEAQIVFDCDVIHPYSIYEPHITNEKRDWETGNVEEYDITLYQTSVLDSDTNVTNQAHFPLNRFRMLAAELSGVIADVELSSTGFDDVCLNTIKRVERALNKIAET
jgi:hypothetical protein